MKLGVLLLLAQCTCFQTNRGDPVADFYHNTTFSHPRFLKTTSPNKIHIGASMKIIQDNNSSKIDFDDGFKNNVKTMFQSILRLSNGASQHWIILTNSEGVTSTNHLLRNVITEHLTRNLVLTYLGRTRVRRVPSVVIDYIDLDTMVTEEGHLEFMETLKAWVAPWVMDGTRKYLDDLFYVGPLYHQIFTRLNKLIFLDVGESSAIVKVAS